MKTRHRTLAFGAVLAAALLASCGSWLAKRTTVAPMSEAAAGFLQARTQPAVSAGSAQAGSKVAITALALPAISGEYVVGESGKIDVPVAGVLAVSGEAAEDIEADVAKQLAASGISTAIHVEVSTSLEKSIELLGAIGQPGRVSLGTQPETLQQVLERAGGVSSTASGLRIRPASGALGKAFAGANPVEAIELPLTVLSSSNPIFVESGDVIEISQVESDRAAPVGPADAKLPDPSMPAAGAAAVPAASPVASAASASPEDAAPVEVSRAEGSMERGSGAPAPGAALSTASVAELSGQIETLRRDLDLARRETTGLRSQMERLGSDHLKLRDEVGRVAARQAAAPASIARPAEGKPSSGGEKQIAARPPLQPDREESKLPKTPPDEERPGDVPVAADSTSHAANVIVSGSVKSPGVYAVSDVRTVAGAIRAAGRKSEANLSAVEVRPDGLGGALLGMGLGSGLHPAKIMVDLDAVASGARADLPLRGGEVIFVPGVRP